MKKRYTITAALPYANGALHFGHLAGAYLPADVYARFLRLMGKELAFVCGSDEHGAAITIRAKKEGRSPQDIIDTYHELNKKTFEKLGISFDVYGRTSSDEHKKLAQEFFLKLWEQGDELQVQSSEQYYDADFDQFLADRYITGTCPKCGHAEAYGDQCEKCGASLSPLDLIEPKSTLSGKAPVLRETKHWYFQLGKHTEWLKDWIEKGTLDGNVLHEPNAWRKHVKGQSLSWLNTEGGLQARAISRDLSWGVPIPLEGAEGKVLYVWFDAPLGYISATKTWADAQGKNWEDYWKSEDAELVHFIGKDNIVFHCIIFPAMLKAHGGYILPTNVPANQFLNLEGRKFSKSKGWAIEQHQYLEDFASFPNKEDALRYVLLRNLPENKDGDFKWDEFVDLYDGELVDIVGNYLNRALTLTQKYYEGKVPSFAAEEPEELLMAEAEQQLNLVEQYILAFQFRDALAAALQLARLGNEYLQSQAPWKLYKTEPDSPRIAAVLGHSLRIAEMLSVALQPFVPFAMAKLRKMLGLGNEGALFTALKAKDYRLQAGAQLGELELLFAKIQDRKNTEYAELVEGQKAKFAALAEALDKEQTASYLPLKAEIDFEQFAGLDLRTGRILAAEAVPKTKKLLKLEIDLGFEQRTVVSGIAEYYKAEEIIGQEVVVVANLAPRQLRGILSQGMILMAEDAEGKLCFVQPSQQIGGGFQVK